MLHFPSRMDPESGGGSGGSTQISGPCNIEGALTKASSSFMYLEAWRRTRWSAWNGKVEGTQLEKGKAEVLEDIMQSLRQRNPGVKVPGLEKQIHK